MSSVEVLRQGRPWPRWFVAGAVATLLPLFVFGGSVTTLGAGLAVEGWWNAEGHFMPLFPLEKWFRDVDTFVEHSHRQFGMVLGLFMLAACVATWIFDHRRSARAIVIAATLAVCVQGWLGGSRVLEKSPELAFLHGSFAQLVFAFLAAVWIHQAPRFRTATARPSGGARPLFRLAVAATVLVYAQIVVGAWYRHGLRTGLVDAADASVASAMAVAGRLHLHLAGALAVLVVIVVLARRLRDAAGEVEGTPEAAQLTRLRRRLHAILGLQVTLGFLAWGAYRPDTIAFFEWAVATSHVLVGAALLATSLATAMWARRALAPVESTRAAPFSADTARIGGAA